MSIRNIRRQATNPLAAPGTPTSAPIYVDSDDNILKMIPAGSGSTEVQIIDASSVQALSNKSIVFPFTTYVNDGAIGISSQIAYLTKVSAGAYTVAAPGAAGIGVELTLTTGTDFAHVVTFTGTTLQDGTAGANVTWTAAAVQGSSLTVVGVTATKWNVVSFNLGTIA
jgi:hypothetical protein